MKWIDGYTCDEKIRRREEWHHWFAWFPVCVGINEEKRKIMIWRETILRKGTFHIGWGDFYWTYEYKELTKRRDTLCVATA